MNMIIQKEELQAKADTSKVIEAAKTVYPDVEIDDSMVEGRTETVVDEKGKESLVFHPGYITVNVPASIKAEEVLSWLKVQTYETTKEEDNKVAEAEKLFDKLMLSPRFKAAISGKPISVIEGKI